MLNRPQLLLQQLGIQSWIPKQSIIKKIDSGQLWRDQSAIIQPITLSIIQSVESKALIKKDVENQARPVSNTKSIEIETSSQLQHIQREIVQDEISLSAEKSIFTVSEDIVMINTTHEIEFQYDVLIHEKFLIFADIIDDAERKLFMNIQKACFASSTQLRWPLQIKGWNSSDQFVESYMQGFLTVHSVKDIIVLGNVQLPIKDSSDLQIHAHASLSTMLEAAQHKRNLWNTLYPLINDDE